MAPQQALQRFLAKLFAHKQWIQYGWVAFGAAAAAIYFLAPSLILKDLIYSALSFCTFLIILLGLAWYRPLHPLPWYLLAITQLFWSVGDFIWMLYDIFVADPPLISIADIIYLAAYPSLALGIYLFTRSKVEIRSRATWIDIAVISVGMAVLSWIFLIEPLSRDTSISPLEQIILITYPLLDLLILIMVLRFVMLSNHYPLAFYLIVISLLGFLFSDTVYIWFTMYDSYVVGNLLDIGWVSAYITMGLAALDPSMAHLHKQSLSDFMQLSRRRLFVMVCAALIPSVALTIQYLLSYPLNIGVYIATTVTLIILSALRLYSMMGALDTSMLRAQHQATHDPLTQLPNRSLFQDRLKQSHYRGERQSSTFAVLFLDLDGFKKINDTWGHNLGDALLVETAQRLQACVRPGDTVARFGGDEFTILLEDIHKLSDAEQIATRILKALQHPFVLGHTTVMINSSIGIAIADADAANLEDMIRCADIAMYQAKVSGKGRYLTYLPTMIGISARS